VSLRDQPPVLEPVRRPSRLSVTLLKHADRCPRSAYLYLRHREGPASHAMMRGSLFHAFAEAMVVELLRVGERTLYSAVEGEDPEHAQTAVASMTKVMVDGLARAHPELVVPAAELDAVRTMAYHLAVGFDVDPQTVAGVERTFVLELEGWAIVGKIDLLHFLQGSASVLAVDDYKTTLAIPTSEGFEDSFQTKLYGAMVMFGRPAHDVPCPFCLGRGTLEDGRDCPRCGGRGTLLELEDPIGEHLTHVRARELYPRAKLRPEGTLTQRRAVYSRTQMRDFLADVQLLVDGVGRRLETGDWPAIPDVMGEGYCTECPASLECPLPKTLRRFAGAVNDHDEAAEALAWAVRQRQAVEATLKEVRNWSAHNGPVRVGETEYAHEVSHSTALKRRGRSSDWEGLQEAVHEAVQYGAPFAVDDWLLQRTSKTFRGRRVAADNDDREVNDGDGEGGLDERFGADAPW
jgi:hypothetical protein